MGDRPPRDGVSELRSSMKFGRIGCLDLEKGGPARGTILPSSRLSWWCCRTGASNTLPMTTRNTYVARAVDHAMSVRGALGVYTLRLKTDYTQTLTRTHRPVSRSLLFRINTGGTKKPTPLGGR